MVKMNLYRITISIFLLAIFSSACFAENKSNYICSPDEMHLTVDQVYLPKIKTIFDQLAKINGSSLSEICEIGEVRIESIYKPSDYSFECLLMGYFRLPSEDYKFVSDIHLSVFNCGRIDYSNKDKGHSREFFLSAYVVLNGCTNTCYSDKYTVIEELHLMDAVIAGNELVIEGTTVRIDGTVIDPLEDTIVIRLPFLY